MQACTTCHHSRQQVADAESFDESAPPHNGFGVRLSEALEQFPDALASHDLSPALRRIAAEDTDGDGVPNEQEIVTGHAPGDAADKPAAAELADVAASLEEFHRREARYAWKPFQPVARPPVSVAAGESRNPIDAFVFAELEAHHLRPRGEASRAVLLRRVSLDLIGLPPTPDELRDFLEDRSPNAYEKVVDRLLANPHYGERWGRHWMDVWRYSDWAGWTDGKQVRDSQPHIWRWRDWIVESLNADKPYDQMVTEMLAADELYPTDADALRATGFLARNYKMLSREIWMQDTVNHTLQAFLGLTVACARCHDHMYAAISQSQYYGLRAIFDPHKVRLDQLPGELDTAKDGLPRVYDADLQAVTYLFRRGDDRDPDKDRALAPGVLGLLGGNGFQVVPVSLPPEAYYPSLKPHVQRELVAAAEKEVAAAESALKQANEALTAAQKVPASEVDVATADMARTKAGLAKGIVAASQARLAWVKARVAADNARYAAPPAANAAELAAAAGKAEREAAYAQAAVDAVKAETKRLAALAALQPGDDKTRQALADAEKAAGEARQKRDAAEKQRTEATDTYTPLGPVYPAQSSGRRTALARWIADRQNPLTARVAVNQIWMRHFGQSLVPTVLDFGQNGQPPTHPELIDWLAAELMEPAGGATSTVTALPDVAQDTPRPWSMKHLHRLIVTSQAYRRASTPDDRNLEADPDNRWLWRMPSRRMEAELVRDGILYVAGQLDLAMGGRDIEHKLGLKVKRRSIYFQHAQEKQMEFLKMFDCAAVTECYQRKESVVPQQALALANSDLTLVQSRIIARELDKVTGGDDGRFVAQAFERVLSRPATGDELRVTVEFLDHQRRTLEALSSQVAATSGQPDDAARPSADVALRARENVVHALLNHHDFVTIR
jgi:hypothetical protein